MGWGTSTLFNNPVSKTVGSAGSGIGDYGTHLANAVGLANSKGKSASSAAAQSVQDQNQATKDQLGTIKGQGDAYTNAMSGYTNSYADALKSAGANYQSQLATTKAQLQNQANDSSAAYTNTVLPNLQDIIGKTKANADASMTLAEAQDPNNRVASATRDMYNQQAQGIQNQGLADYGVLAALGGQATARTIGASGTPLLGGQLQSIQNSNMGQASQAYGNAQSNANNLRLQGISAGQNQSNWAYGQGQDAINSYGNATTQYGNANNMKNQIANNYTQQMAGVDQNSYGTSLGQAGALYNANAAQAGLQYGVQNQQNNNALAQINQQYGSQQAIDNAQAQAANAAQAGKVGALGSIFGAGIGYSMGGFDKATGAAGAAAGGPAGAAAAGGGGGGGQSSMASAAQGAQLGNSIFSGFGGQAAPVYQSSPYQTQGYQPYNPYGR